MVNRRKSILQMMMMIQNIELDIFSKRIIYELRETIYAYNKNLDEYRFFEIAKLLYNFIWGKFCDEYIEISKPMLFEAKKKNSLLYTPCVLSWNRV